MAPPKPKPKTAGKLGKKAGPLPIWAWALLGVGGAVLLYLVLRRNTEQTGAGVQLVTGGAGNPQDAPSGGYPSAATPPAQMLNEDVLWTIAGSLSTIAESQAEQHSSLGEQVAGVKDHVSQTVAGATFQPPAVTTPTAAAAPRAPKPAANQLSGPSRYYTYKPGKAPAGRKGDEAPAGSRLGFTAGKGYYVIK